MTIPPKLEEKLADLRQDYCHRFKCYSYPSLLVWNIVLVMLDSFSTYLGFLLPHHRTKISPTCCVVSLHGGYNRRICRQEYCTVTRGEMPARFRRRRASGVDLCVAGRSGQSSGARQMDVYHQLAMGNRECRRTDNWGSIRRRYYLEVDFLAQYSFLRPSSCWSSYLSQITSEGGFCLGETEDF